MSFRMLFLHGLFGLALSLSGKPVQAVHTTIELVADTSTVVPGETFHLGVTFRMEPEWHIYWKNPGASGLPPEFTWNLSEGFKVGEVQWPRPERIALEGLVSYGYKDEVTFIIPVTPPEDLESTAEIPIRLELFYLICKEVCLPGDASLELLLPAGTTQPEAQNQEIFRAARASQPGTRLPFEVLPSALEDKTLTLEFKGTNLPEALYFYSEVEGMINPNAEQAYTVGEGRGRLQLPLSHAFFEREATELTGVLDSPEGSWAVRLPAMPQVGGAGETSTLRQEPYVLDGPKGLEGWLLRQGMGGWLLLAFIGGLILNVMPCVLPVLSLKVFSLLKHSGQSRGDALAHGLAYTLGVVSSFLVLAGVLFALRGLGQSIGWGFQLQNPGFVLVLGLVFFLFGLNLLGVFEIGSGLVGADAKVAGRKDLFGSFGVGVLAAVVGAPCVGPFVGVLSGLALQAETLTGLLLFGMLGFGMASPFLVLAIFPKLAAYLPKPGLWMETFKHAMGFLLMASLVFVIHLMGQLAGLAAMTATLVVLLAAAVAAWGFGRWAAPVKPRRTRSLARLMASVLLLLATAWGLRAVEAAYDQSAPVAGAVGTEGESWAPWSAEVVERSLAKGKLVFIDFTASWCLICQANKKTALRTEATRQLFETHGVVSLSADWTRRDPAITAELEKFRRSGVPLYVLYHPEGGVRVLPQNLTNGIMREAVESF